MTDNKEYIIMLKDMINRQRDYDDAVYEEFDVDFDETKCVLALFDELGEVNHELKATWCYWKKTQKPVEEAALLEELADCWHFALSYYYHTARTDEFERDAYNLFHYHEMTRPESSIRKNITWYESQYIRIVEARSPIIILEGLLEISLWCGFTFKGIYEAYCLKNKKNWERLKTGY